MNSVIPSALYKKFEGELRVGFGHPWSAALEIFEIFYVKEIVEDQLVEDLKNECRLSATKDTSLKRKFTKI